MLPHTSLRLLLTAISSFGTAASTRAESVRGDRCSEKGAFFLAGHSTTAQTATSGGGWGNGFLTTIAKDSFGMNYGHNGADTVSFRNGGDWGRVLAQVTKSKKLDYNPFFGHNDQKASHNISIDMFQINLKQMVYDVKAAGGTPILVTSLTRRNFDKFGLVIEDLAPQVNATIDVAKSMGVHCIDLNRASTEYVNRIGFNLSATYNLIATNYTHLNAHGAMLFGHMVSQLIDKSMKEMREFTKANSTLVTAIKEGNYVFPALPATVWTNSTAPIGFSY